MNPGVKRKRTPDPSATRTDKDWVMIVIGLALIVLFAFGGYTTVFEGDKGAAHKFKGPVKDPKSMGMTEAWDYHAKSRINGPSARLAELSSGRLPCTDKNGSRAGDLRT